MKRVPRLSSLPTACLTLIAACSAPQARDTAADNRELARVLAASPTDTQKPQKKSPGKNWIEPADVPTLQPVETPRVQPPPAVPERERASSPMRKGVMPTGICPVRRQKALFRDTVQSYAARNRLSVAAFLRINGLKLPPDAKLVHNHRYVMAYGTEGEHLAGGRSMGPSTSQYIVVNPSRAWGQPFAVDLLKRAIALVFQKLPGGNRPVIEDVSIEHGGCLVPHREHRGGLEADVGFFHKQQFKHLTIATPENFDARREWFFLRALLESGHVTRIIVDRKVQALLYREAKRQGATSEQLAKWLQYPRKTKWVAIIVHGGGHDNHTHIKFKCSPGDCATPVDVPDLSVPVDVPDDETPTEREPDEPAEAP